MTRPSLDRRKFNQFTATALGGMIAGATFGCGPEETATAVTAEKHLCRGLNSCKGKGASGDNACAGQGTCATVEHNSCGNNNTCKNLGGCGETVGSNDCKGQGGCQIPLMETAWDTMRTRFEKKMNNQGKEYGEAPSKPAEA